MYPCCSDDVHLSNVDEHHALKRPDFDALVLAQLDAVGIAAAARALISARPLGVRRRRALSILVHIVVSGGVVEGAALFFVELLLRGQFAGAARGRRGSGRAHGRERRRLRFHGLSAMKTNKMPE